MFEDLRYFHLLLVLGSEVLYVYRGFSERLFLYLRECLMRTARSMSVLTLVFSVILGLFALSGYHLV